MAAARIKKAVASAKKKASNKKRKRKANLINTPKRMLMDSEEDWLHGCVEAANGQVAKQEEAVLELVAKLCRANKKLTELVAARARYATRYEKARAQRLDPVNEDTALALSQGWE